MLRRAETPVYVLLCNSIRATKKKKKCFNSERRARYPRINAVLPPTPFLVAAPALPAADGLLHPMGWTFTPRPPTVNVPIVRGTEGWRSGSNGLPPPRLCSRLTKAAQ